MFSYISYDGLTSFLVLLIPNKNSNCAKIRATDKFLWINVRADLENLYTVLPFKYNVINRVSQKIIRFKNSQIPFFLRSDVIDACDHERNKISAKVPQCKLYSRDSLGNRRMFLQKTYPFNRDTRRKCYRSICLNVDQMFCPSNRGFSSTEGSREKRHASTFLLGSKSVRSKLRYRLCSGVPK